MNEGYSEDGGGGGGTKEKEQRGMQEVRDREGESVSLLLFPVVSHTIQCAADLEEDCCRVHTELTFILEGN